MTRQDYIYHLDTLRKGIIELLDFDARQKKKNGGLSDPTEIEDERAKKTQKMMLDLSVRLYEDGAVSERVKQDKLTKGDFEQAEITFPEDEPEQKPAKRKAGAK